MQGSEFSSKTDKKRREGKGRGGEGKEREENWGERIRKRRRAQL